MEAVLKLELSERESRGVRELIALCNETDGTNYDPSAETEGDFYYLIRNEEASETAVSGELLSFLSAYRLGGDAEEGERLAVSAFTHPGIRRQGLFRLCLNSLRDDFRSFSYRFLVKCAAGREEAGEIPEHTRHCLLSIGAERKKDELFLEKLLPRGISDPGDSLSDRFGELHFTPYSKDTLYLYGLLVYDSYLRQGHGRALLKKAEQYKAGPYRRILLQADSRNLPALSLYRSENYIVTDRICCFDLGEKPRKKEHSRC